MQNCRDWDAGVPIETDRVREKDEKYWDEFRGSPKAFVTLAAGQRMWANRFGNLTAVRTARRKSGTGTMNASRLLLELRNSFNALIQRQSA
jgi:hypothetical protein